MVLALLAFPAAAHAIDVWTVGPTGDFQTIGDALAVSLDGDRILVDPGTYVECPNIVGLEVDLIATGGPGVTTLQCNGSAPYAVEISGGAQVRLDGFTIAHGQGLGGIRANNSNLLLSRAVLDGMTSTSGAGCVDGTSSFMSIYGTSLSNCVGTEGGAVRLDAGILGLVDVDIDTASATNNGGAVSYGGTNLRLSGLRISNASAGNRGGGLYLSSASTFTLRDLEITDSQAVWGGGLYHAGPLTLVDPLFERNEAFVNVTGGEGGAVYGTSTLTVQRGAFRNNTAKYYGGAIIETGTAVTLTGAEFEGNAVGDPTYYGTGGAVAMYGAANPVLTTHGNTFTGNSATGSAGALYTFGTWKGRNDVFTDNSAVNGGAAFVQTVDVASTEFASNDVSNLGGAIYHYGGATILNTSFTGNTASQGGAIFDAASLQANYQYCTFADNSAGTGGALFVNASGLVSIYYSEFDRNHSSTDGGAIFQTRTGASTSVGLDVTWSRFASNTADDEGGAIYAAGAYLQTAVIVFLYNTAGTRGGAIYANGTGSFSHVYDIFCGNHAGADGGAVYGQAVPNGSFGLSAFQENSATGLGGGYYEASRTDTTTRTEFDSVTVVGNTGTSGNDGLAGAGSARMHLNYSVLQENGATAIGITGASTAGPVYVEQTEFFGHANNVVGGGTPVVWQGPNVYFSTDPPSKPIPDAQWSRDGNCENDDLTSHWPYMGPTNGVSRERLMYTDDDGDGMAVAAFDCNLSDGSSHRGGIEVPGNSIDEDCLLGDDRDADGDGFDPTTTFSGADCADSDAATNPLATEVAGDGIDQDCFGGDLTDGDGDGANGNSDCADDDPQRIPGMAEIPYDGTDRNCIDDEYDADNDGYTSAAFGGDDCNDYRGGINPAASDAPYDGIDTNCDGHSDFDADFDGFDAIAWGGTDCNDADPTWYPGGPEVYYDGVDQNCDAHNDYDADGDGWVPTAYNAFAGGTAPGLDDCDDTNSATYPGAVEITDGRDNTCDGVFNPDPDFDGDGVLDNWETAFGSNPAAVDSDSDTIEDGDEWGPDEQHPYDSDGDGTVDALEWDSDNDTIADIDENLQDHDGDGTPDCRDADDDGDDIPTLVETDGLGLDGPDTDGDGTPDWLDDDSDDDGALDVTEGMGDPDQDGIGAWRDDGANGDGSGVTPAGPKYGFGCGCSAAPSPAGAWAVVLLLFALRRRSAGAFR